MTRGDFGLEHVGSPGSANAQGPFERGEAAADEELIPQGAVLIEQENRFSRRSDSGPRS
jgi:hypothetical protein